MAYRPGMRTSDNDALVLDARRPRLASSGRSDQLPGRQVFSIEADADAQLALGNLDLGDNPPIPGIRVQVIASFVKDVLLHAFVLLRRSDLLVVGKVLPNFMDENGHVPVGHFDQAFRVDDKGKQHQPEQDQDGGHGHGGGRRFVHGSRS